MAVDFNQANRSDGFVISEDEWNDVIDTLNSVGQAWTSYTPTLTQSGAVTKTATYAKYIQTGKTVRGNAYLTVTGSGTGSNAVKVGLPVAAATTAASIIGTGYILDSSANLLYTAVVTVASSTEVQLLAAVNGAAVQVLGASSFTAALASGDLVQVVFSYEAA